MGSKLCKSGCSEGHRARLSGAMNSTTSSHFEISLRMSTSALERLVRELWLNSCTAGQTVWVVPVMTVVRAAGCEALGRVPARHSCRALRGSGWDWAVWDASLRNRMHFTQHDLLYAALLTLHILRSLTDFTHFTRSSYMLRSFTQPNSLYTFYAA